MTHNSPSNDRAPPLIVLLILVVGLSLANYLAVCAELDEPTKRTFTSSYSSFKHRTNTLLNNVNGILTGAVDGPKRAKAQLYDNLIPLEYNLVLEIQTDQEESHINGLVEIYVEFSRSGKASSSSAFVRKWQLAAQAMSCRMIDLDGPASNTITLNVGDEGLTTIKEAQVEYGHSLESLKRGGRDVQQVGVLRRELDAENKILALIMAKPLPFNAFGRITIKFSSLYANNFVRYANSFKPPRPYVNFNFALQSLDRTFPHVNRPKYRAKFSLTIAADQRFQVYSGVPIAEEKHTDRFTLDGLDNNFSLQPLTRTNFAQTPAMPVHKFMFSLGQYDELISSSKIASNLEPRVRLVTPNGVPSTGRFALKLAQKAFGWMTRVTDNRLSIKEFNIVATASGPQDDAPINSTVSLGCALINSDFVLLNEQESSPETKILAALNVAQAVAQQWFGNLISPTCWRDEWITNGLAAYLAIEMLQELEPELGVEHYVRSHLLTRSLQARAVRLLRGTSDQWDLKFMRHAAIISLVQALTGRDQFYSAIKSLLKGVHTASGKLIDQSGFVATLSKATHNELTETDLNAMLEAWLKYSTFPVLSVQLTTTNINKAQLKIYQNPAHKLDKLDTVGPSIGNRNVQIPLRVLFKSQDGSRRQLVEIKQAFKRDRESLGPNMNEIEVPIPEWWLELNENFKHQHGSPGPWIQVLVEPGVLPFYATRYMNSGHLMDNIERAIESKLLSTDGKISLLNDASALVPIDGKYLEASGISRLINLGLFDHEQDPVVLSSLLLAKERYVAAISAGNVIDSTKSTGMTSPLRNSKRIFDLYGFSKRPSESVFEQFVRGNALSDLIRGNYEPAIGAALEAFDRDSPIEAFASAPVYEAVAKDGSDERMQKLLKKLESTEWPEEIDRLRATLKHSKKPAIQGRVSLWCRTHSCTT